MSAPSWLTVLSRRRPVVRPRPRRKELYPQACPEGLVTSREPVPASVREPVLWQPASKISSIIPSAAPQRLEKGAIMKKPCRLLASPLVRCAYDCRFVVTCAILLIAAWAAPTAGAQLNGAADAGVERAIIAAQLEYQVSRVIAYQRAQVLAKPRFTALPSGGYALTLDLPCRPTRPCADLGFPEAGSWRNGRMTLTWFVSEAMTTDGRSLTIRLMTLP